MKKQARQTAVGAKAHMHTLFQKALSIVLVLMLMLGQVQPAIAMAATLADGTTATQTEQGGSATGTDPEQGLGDTPPPATSEVTSTPSQTTSETTSVATSETTSVATSETTSVATSETTSVATSETTSVATSETTSVATSETTSEETIKTVRTLFGDFALRSFRNGAEQTLYMIDFNNIQMGDAAAVEGVPFYTSESVVYPAEGYNAQANAIIPELQKDGYIFKGWATSLGGTVLDLNSYLPKPAAGATIELYAVYEEIVSTVYTINYQYENGVMAYPSASVQLTADETATVTSPTIEGAMLKDDAQKTITLIGGTSNETTTVVYKEATGTANYTINYYLQNVENDEYTLDASETITGEAEVGDKVSMEGVANADKTFEGFTRMAGDPGVIMTANDDQNVINIYYTRNTYYMTFDSKGGTQIATIVAKYDAPITTPTAKPTQENMTFKGFTASYGSDITANMTGFPTKMPASDVHYVAKWEGKAATYTIAYWMEKPNVLPSVDLKTNSTELYDTSNYLNVGMSAPITGQKAGQTVNLDVSKLNNLDYATYAWTDATNYTVRADGTTVVNVYYTRTVYTLTFDAGERTKKVSNGFLGIGAKYETRDNQLIVNGTKYGRTGYTITAKFEQDIESVWPAASVNASVIDGWGNNLGLHGWDDPASDSTMVSKRFTLLENLIPTSGTKITIKPVTGTSGSEQLKYYFEQLPGQTGTTKTFGTDKTVYVLDTAYTQSAPKGDYSAKPIEGMQAGLSNDVSGGTEFYYKRDRFDLAFNLMGGTDSGNTTQTEKDVMFEQSLASFEPKATDLSKDGYTFAGWYYDAEMLNPVDWSTFTMPNVTAGNKTLTVFAKWEAPSIIFDANGGALVSYTADGAVANSVTTLKLENTEENRVYGPEGYTPVREGYVFDGWYLDGKEFLFDQTFDKDITLTANWVAASTDKYTVRHQHVADGNTYEYDVTVNGQQAGATLTVYPLTSAELVATGEFPAGYYTATPASQEVTVVGGEVATVTFTYTKVDAAEYPYEVKFVGVNLNGDPVNLGSYTMASNTNSTVTVHPDVFLGYTLDAGQDQRSFDLSNSANRVITFYYTQQDLSGDYNVNIYLPNGDLYDSVKGSTSRFDVLDPTELTAVKSVLASDALKSYVVDETKTSPAQLVGLNKTYNVYLKQVLPGTVDEGAIFDANGGAWTDNSTTKPVVATLNAEGTAYNVLAANVPEAPARDNYVFEGWATTATGTTTVDPTDYDFDPTQTFYAVWSEEIITLNYYTNTDNNLPLAPDTGATDYLYTQKVNLVTGMDVTNDPNSKTPAVFITPDSETGLSFMHWEPSQRIDDRNTTEHNAGEKITLGNSMDLYGIWTPIQVTFDGNSGTLTGDTTVNVSTTDGTWDTEPTATRDGYTFAGWNTKADGTGTAATTDTVFTASTTVYAQWSATATVATFYNNHSADDTSVFTTQNTSVEVKPTEPTTDPTRTGYEFKGWTDAADGTTSVVFANENGAVSNSYYAMWEAKTYDITFDGNGETSGTMAADTATYGSSYTIPANQFEKDGYTFTGWKTANGVPYADGATIVPVTGNIKLIAQWSATATVATFYNNHSADDTSVFTTQNTSVEVKPTKPTTDPTRDGYEFKGWTTTADGTTAANFATANGAINNSYYAMWEVITVTFMPNTGILNGDATTASITENVEADGTWGTAPTATKVDYDFTGWNTEADGTGDTVTDTSVFETSTTVYAQYAAHATWDIDADGLTLYYNGTAQQAVTAEATGLPQGTTVTWSYSTDGLTFHAGLPTLTNVPTEEATSTKGSQTYLIRATVEGRTPITTFAYATMNRAPLDLVANKVTVNAMSPIPAEDSLTYALNGTVYANGANNVTAETNAIRVAIGKVLAYANAPYDTSTARVYNDAIIFNSIAVNDAVGTNYYVKSLTANDLEVLTLGKVPTPTVGAANQTLPYNGSTQTFNGGATATVGAVIEYKVEGGDWSTTAPTLKDVSEGTITVSVRATQPGYTDSETVTYTASITPVELTVTPNHAGITYGEADPTTGFDVSITGFVGGETATVITNNIAQAAFDTAYTTGDDAGDYALTLTRETGDLVAANDNYTFNVVAGTFNVAKADLAVVPTAGQSMVFGDTVPVIDYSFVTPVNGDTQEELKTELGGNPFVTNATSASSTSADYTITKLATAPAELTNYNLSYNEDTLFAVTTSNAMTLSALDSVLTYNGQAQDMAQSAQYQAKVGGVNYDNVTYTFSTTSATANDFTATMPTITEANGISWATDEPLYVKVTDNSGNYASVVQTIDVRVKPATITVVANDETINAYDAIPADNTLTYDVTSTVYADSVTGDTMDEVKAALEAELALTIADRLTIDNTAPATHTDAIDFTGITLSNTNYVVGTATPADLIINGLDSGLTLRVSAATQSQEYTGAALSFDGGATASASVAGVVPTIQYSTDGSTWSATAPTLTNVADSKTIYVKATAQGYNNPATADFKAEVTPATLTVTPAHADVTYGDAVPADGYTFSVAGYKTDADKALGVAGDVAQDMYQTAYAADVNGRLPDAGTTHAVTFKTNALNTLTATNYKFAAGTSEMDVVKAILNVTPDADQSVEHGTVPQPEDIAYTIATVLNGDSETALKAEIGNPFITNVTATSVVGTDYEISKRVGATTEITNYTLNYGSSDAYAPFEVTLNTSLAITATAYNDTYDAAAHDAITAIDSVSIDGYSLTAAELATLLETGSVTVNGKTITAAYVSTGDMGYSSTMPTVTNVVDSRFVRVAISASNYQSVDSGRLEAVVSPADLTIKADDKTWVYDQAQPTLTSTPSGLQGTDSVDNIGLVVDLRTTATAASLPGEYPITASGAATTANYDVTYVAGTMTVEANDTIIIDGGELGTEAQAYTGEYDAADHAAVGTVGVTANSGVVLDGALIEYRLDGGEWTTVVPEIRNADDYTLEIRASKDGYNSKTITVNPKITPATLTVTAENKTWVYAQTQPDLTSSNDLLGADSLTTVGLDLTHSTTATAASLPGEGELVNGNYAITVSGNAMTDDGNYEVVYVPGEMTVAENETIEIIEELDGEIYPVVTPYTGQYDADEHAAVGSVGALTDGAPDAGVFIEYSLDGGAWTEEVPEIRNADDYSLAIRASKAGYTTKTIVVNPAITPAPLTVTAEAKAMEFGTELPEFTSVIETFQGADTLATAGLTVSYSTTATTTSLPGAGELANGNYAITVTGPAITTDGNYTVEYISNELAIADSDALAVVATSYNGTYDAAAHDAIASTATTQPGATLTYSLNGGAFSTEIPTVTDAGTYTVTVRAELAGYVPVETTQTGTIDPKAVTVIVGSATKVAGAADPALTATVVGMEGADILAYTVARAVGEGVASYAITATYTADPNYVVTVIDGTFTITAAPVVPAPVVPVVVPPVVPVVPVVPDDTTTTIDDGPVPLAPGTEEDPTTEIEDPEIPLAAADGSWALLNLILAIVTSLTSIVLLVGYFATKSRRDDDEETDETVKRKGFARVFSLLPAIVAIVTFFLTEDMTQPMVIVDNWTILMLAFALIQVVVAFLSRKTTKTESDDNNRPATA